MQCKILSSFKWWKIFTFQLEWICGPTCIWVAVKNSMRWIQIVYGETSRKISEAIRCSRAFGRHKNVDKSIVVGCFITAVYICVWIRKFCSKSAASLHNRPTWTQKCRHWGLAHFGNRGAVWSRAPLWWIRCGRWTKAAARSIFKNVRWTRT